MPEIKEERMANFDSNAYCKASDSVGAVGGKEVLTCIFDSDGTNLLAIEGEQESKLSMETETVEASTKDPGGGWKVQRPSVKSWSLDLDTIVVKDAAANLAIRKAFQDGKALCMKQVYDDTAFTPICGGSCYVTKYEQGAPADDVATASIGLVGDGKLTWFDIDSTAKEQATSKPTNRG